MQVSFQSSIIRNLVSMNLTKSYQGEPSFVKPLVHFCVQNLCKLSKFHQNHIAYLNNNCGNLQQHDSFIHHNLKVYFTSFIEFIIPWLGIDIEASVKRNAKVRPSSDPSLQSIRNVNH